MLYAYTLFHVLISLIAIATGFVVIFAMLASKRLNTLTHIFLATTVLTSVTGFFFPVSRITPAHIFGVVSLILLAFTLHARYRRNLAGNWRWIFVVTAIIAQYLNCFVLVVQSFLKIPALHALAPTQTEPPFAIAQGLNFLLFLTLGILATKKFRPA